MSLRDYEKGQELELHCLENDIGFYAVIQCAMRMADTQNLYHLKTAWPGVHAELLHRYHAPGGLLEGE